MAKNRQPKGDTESRSPEQDFLRAFDEYADALFRHASYRLSDRERAIEIVHDTFTKVWGYQRGGHEILSYKSFLYKVLNNLIVDEYRRQKEVSLDALLEESEVGEGAFEYLQEGGIEELTFSLDAKRVADLIVSLPVQYREVITLRFVDGLGPREISELIEETENVVSVRIHRGIKLLRTMLEDAEEVARKNRSTHTSP
ncbi:RNA polymerase sigma factor [Candidatus Kaiserbacteria bacterium]|nr:RNA polymerase sigma factor [Candidatus Kaiserbacteria bacterium]